MRLSMWMLADWLKGYEPAVQIEAGSVPCATPDCIPKISGIRVPRSM